MRSRFRPSHLLTVLALAALIVSPAVPGAIAQEKPKKPAPSGAKPAAAPQRYGVPQAETLVVMIRTALLTLNDAVQTGNYTVLRDRASPAFRQANTASRLTRVFANLEEKRLDFSAVAIMSPQLTNAAIVGPEQRLHLQGHFPSKPLQINFEMLYEAVGGRWMLFGLSVGAVPAQNNASAAQAPAGGTPSGAGKKPAPKKSN